MKRIFVLVMIASSILIAARGPLPAGQFDEDLISMRQRMALKSLEAEIGPVKAYFDKAYQTPRFIEGKLGEVVNDDHFKTSISFLKNHTGLFGIDNPENEFYVWTLQFDELGYAHLKLQQKYNGLRVKGKQLIFHFDNIGELYCISGNYVRTPDISTVPVILESEAALSAKTSFTQVSFGDVSYMESELLILPDEEEPALAWEFVVQGERIDECREIVIDAQTGEILRNISLIFDDGPVTGSGTGVNGGTRTLHLYQIGSSYKCIDATKPMFGGTLYNGVIVTKDMEHGMLEYVADTSKPIVSSSSTTVSDPAAVDGHFYFSGVYDFYSDGSTWNSFDNSGHNIKCYVHLGSEYNNAFWQPEVKAFFFGDGNGTLMKPLSAAGDVCCHEFQHAVTSHTADLEYRMQSGALNEAYSDIAASCFDPDWEIGEDIAGPSMGGGAMRFMDDPHSSDPPLPASMAEFEHLPESMDNGGVHINMSIPSLAFANMVDAHLGRERGWEIWFRALRHYLTPTSEFTDGAVNVLRAAEDLYETAGDWDDIESAICDGFDGVGLNAGCGGTAPPDYDGDFLYLFNEDAVEIHPFFMPDTQYYDQYACAVRFTPPAISGLKVVGIHFGIAYCWTMSDMDMYLGSCYSSGGEIYPDSAFALYTIPNDELWLAVADTSYVVSALFDEPVTDDFFAVAHCPDSDPYPPVYDFVLTAVDDASTSAGDGNRNITTDTEMYWVTMDYWWGNDYNLLMAASVTYPGADAPELLFPNKPVTFGLKSPSPNPFNASTTIKYTTPFEDARLEVYDLLGKKVVTLMDGGMLPGENKVTWDGKDSNGNRVPSGTYLVKLSRDIWTQSRKITLIK